MITRSTRLGAAVVLVLSLLANHARAGEPPPSISFKPGELRVDNTAKRRLGMALFVVGTSSVLAGGVLVARGMDCSPTYYAISTGHERTASDCMVAREPLLAGGMVAILLGSGVAVTGILLRLEGRRGNATANQAR